MDYLVMIIASSVTLSVVVLAVVIIAYTFFLLAKEIKDDFFCEWTSSGEDNSGYTACKGTEFYNSSDNGECVTSWVTFCPYCGKRIKLRK